MKVCAPTYLTGCAAPAEAFHCNACRVAAPHPLGALKAVGRRWFLCKSNRDTTQPRSGVTPLGFAVTLRLMLPMTVAA